MLGYLLFCLPSFSAPPVCPVAALAEPVVFTSPEFQRVKSAALAEGRNTLVNHLPLIMEKGGAATLKAAGVDDIFDYDADVDAVLQREQARLMALEPAAFFRQYADPIVLQTYLQSPDVDPAKLAGLSGRSPSGKKALEPNSAYLALGNGLAEQLVARLRAEGKIR